MFKLREYGVCHSPDQEDRACVAVAFAWSWSDFSIETDGDCRPGHIIFKPTEMDQYPAFRDKFIPALNAELESHGFRELTQYGSNKFFYDLDDPDDLPSMMDMCKILRRNGVKYTLAEMREIGKVAIAAQVKAVTGSRYFEFDTTFKLVSFRDENGRLCSSP